MITIGELINSIVAQISMQFPDQDREATAEDAVAMLQTMLIVCKAFTERLDSQ